MVKIHIKNFIILTFFAVIFSSCKKVLTDNDTFIETEPPVLQSNFVKVNDIISGFYSAIPAHYGESSKSYPVIIWLHGNGQVGNGGSDLPSILYGGIPKLLNEKKFPSNFEVNGKNFSFIVLAPQFHWWPGIEEVKSFIDYAKSNYRVDASRIYLTGLSMGGIVTADFGAEYTSTIAAIVPVAGVSIDNVENKCASIANGKLPVWVFQNLDDEVFDSNLSKRFVSTINSFKSTIGPKYTVLSPYGENGHDAWTMATNPDYKENNLNIYEWMLQFTR